MTASVAYRAVLDVRRETVVFLSTTAATNADIDSFVEYVAAVIARFPFYSDNSDVEG